MQPAALIFLETTEARKLAAAWQYLGDDREDETWASLAGVSTFRAKSSMAILRASGICRDDGTTDPMALQFIAVKAYPEAMRANGRAKGKTDVAQDRAASTAQEESAVPD